MYESSLLKKKRLCTKATNHIAELLDTLSDGIADL